MNLNKVIIAGRLTADPILRTTTTGQQVATFSVATNRYWFDQANQKKEATEFHNIVVWGKTADIVSRFLTKGGLVLVEGRLQTRVWDDKQGQKRRTTEIIGERIQLGPKPFGASTTSSFSKPSGSGVSPVETASFNEIPTVNLDEQVELSPEIKPEDLPF